MTALNKTRLHAAAILCSLVASGGPLQAATRTIAIRHDRTMEASIELAKPYGVTARISGVGSGTLIAPRWIATAAHVAQGLSPFDHQVFIQGERYTIDRVVFPPGAEPTELGMPPRVDLALLELDRVVEGIRPATLYRDSEELEQPVLIVGYGDHGLAGEGFSPSDGQRRAVTNVIDRLQPGRVFVTFNAPEEDGTEMEGMGAPGDSGGPLLLLSNAPQASDQKAEDPLVLIGVSSFSDGRPGQYGSRDVYTRVSAYADWIDEILADPPPTMIDAPKTRDLQAGGYADTPEAEILKRFFEAYNTADEEKLLSFSRELRLRGARQDEPDEAWVRRITTKREKTGSLKPLLLATGGMGEPNILAEAQATASECVLFFLLQEQDGPKLDDLLIQLR